MEPAGAQWHPSPAQYRADGITETPEGPFGYEVYYDRGIERRQPNGGDIGAVLIRNFETGKLYSLFPPSDVMSISQLHHIPLPSPYRRGTFNIRNLGREEIHGEETIKFHVTGVYELDDDRVDALFWMTDDGIMVRFQGSANTEFDSEATVMYLENIVRGPQDPDLFVVPDNMRVIRRTYKDKSD